MSLSATSLATLDGCAQAQLLRNGQLSALELTDAAIARIERLNPLINAVASTGFEAARHRARSALPNDPLAGVPTLIKDLMAYPGLPLGLGGRLLPPVPALAGSPYTQALDSAGLVVLGKSATSEFGLLGTTEPVGAAPARNPWNPSLSPGGSSGGAVAAVASGMVAVAHASDGGGSIRGPASFCGLFGFKPSRGRTVSTGMPEDGLAARLLSDHCVSRSVRDSLAWLQVTERRDGPVQLPSLDALRAERRPLRIGVYRRDVRGEDAGPDAVAAVALASRTCEALGHHVVEVAAPAIDAARTAEAFFTLSGSQVAMALGFLRGMLGDAYDEAKLEPYTRDLVRRARALPPSAFAAAAETLSAAEAMAAQAMAGFDILLSPTVGFPAFELGRYTPDASAAKLDAFVVQLASYTFLASVAGWPAMSVPLYWTKGGLPMGCHFAGAIGKDAMLFSLALQLEEALPWQPRFAGLMDKLHAATA